MFPIPITLFFEVRTLFPKVVAMFYITTMSGDIAVTIFFRIEAPSVMPRPHSLMMIGLSPETTMKAPVGTGWIARPLHITTRVAIIFFKLVSLFPITVVIFFI